MLVEQKQSTKGGQTLLWILSSLLYSHRTNVTRRPYEIEQADIRSVLHGSMSKDDWTNNNKRWELYLKCPQLQPPPFCNETNLNVLMHNLTLLLGLIGEVLNVHFQRHSYMSDSRHRALAGGEVWASLCAHSVKAENHSRDHSSSCDFRYFSHFLSFHSNFISLAFL